MFAYEWSDIAELMNEQVKGKIGEDSLVTADLSNVADFGKKLENLDESDIVGVFKGLLVKITKTVVKDLNLSVEFPYLYRTAEDWGGIVESVKILLPEAQSPSNHNLVNDREYPDNVYKAPNLKCVIWNGPEASFEFQYSIDTKDWKVAFKGPDAFKAFITARHNAVRKAIVLRKNMIARDAVCAMIGETVHNEFSTGQYAASSGIRAINLGYLYNQSLDAQHQKDDSFDWRKDKEFQRFIRREISVMPKRLESASVLYNMDGDLAQSGGDNPLHTILLNDFVQDNKAYFLTDAFRDEITLPEHDTVDYWQGTGTAPTFSTRSKVNVTTNSNHAVELDNIIGCMFSERAISIHNEDENMRTKYVASGDFYNYWVTVDGKIIEQPDENFVVFFVQFPEAQG